jgi:hypothetical protein
MKVYIASMFADKDRVKARGKELAADGITCTSRWVDENAPHTATIKDFPDEYFRETAAFDIVDILAADKVVLTVPSEEMLADATPRASSRGGRHFESGFVYGLILAQMMDGGKPTRELVICGKRENVFHFIDGLGAVQHLPAIKQFDTWEDTKKYLVEANNGI